jgi:Apolipoprotein N-acyltransferase
LIAYSFSNQIEILNITSMIGTYGFNIFCISLFTSPSLFILRDNKKDFIICIVFLITTVFFYVSGLKNLDKFNKEKLNKHDYKIRIVSSNISIDRFYKNIDPISVIEDLIEISSPKKNEKIIFIWPEGILPGISQDQIKEYKWLFENKFNENHLIAIGINSKENARHVIKYFNSFSIYDHDLNLIDSYEKINLVPFGEFLPFEKILKNVGLKQLLIVINHTQGVEREILLK